MAFWKQNNKPKSKQLVVYTETNTKGMFKSTVLKGRVLPGAERFYVKLQHAEHADSTAPRPDIALQLKFCYGVAFGWINTIVGNTLQEGKWGKDKWELSPLKRGQDFTLKIYSQDDGFKVIVNEEYILHYKHRISQDKICTVVINGGVKVESVKTNWGESAQRLKWRRLVKR